jgi:hypothetical protein
MNMAVVVEVADTTPAVQPGDIWCRNQPKLKSLYRAVRPSGSTQFASAWLMTKVQLRTLRDIQSLFSTISYMRDADRAKGKWYLVRRGTDWTEQGKRWKWEPK